MSEILWNIVWVTLVGSLIVIIRKMYVDKIHPQILTIFWGVFLIVSLLPINAIAELGAAIGDVNVVNEIKHISTNRQSSYLKLINGHYGSSILLPNVRKEMVNITCEIIWVIGLVLSIIIKIMQEIRFNQKISKECIGVHSFINKGKRKTLSVFITKNVGPMVYGIIPNIYVPQKFIENDALKSILLHEKVHIIRKHHLLLALLDISSCIYWFLPYYGYFLKCLREDMEYRCDYEIVTNWHMNPKEYALHYVFVNGCQSGLDVSLNFGEGQFMKRINRILNREISKKKTLFSVIILGITILTCGGWVFAFYLLQDANGLTKWEVNQAKNTVISMLNAANEGDVQDVISYIYEPGPLSEAIAYKQYDLYHIEYSSSATSYYEKTYREQHQLQPEEFVHLEGILKLEGSEMLWGFSLVFDEESKTWKLYDWGQ